MLNTKLITKLQNDLVYRGESFKDLSPRKKQTAIQDEAWIGEEMHRDAIMYFHQEMEEKFAKTPFENSQMSPSEYDAWQSKKDDWQRENLTREKIDTFHKDWIYRKENNLEQKKGVFERE